MKKILALILAAAMILSLAACNGSKDTTAPDKPAETTTEAPNNDPIKIGSTDYITGVLAAYMVWSRVGTALAFKHINDAGGVCGHPLEQVKVDIGGADVATMMQRMTELKEAGCVAITTTTTTNPAQWAADEKIPTFVTNNVSTQVTIANYNPYLYFTGFSAWGISKIIANAAVGEQGLKSFAYIGVDTDDTRDAEKALLVEGQKLNPDFKCVGSYRMDYSDDKYATIVSTVMSQADQPEMILQQGGGANFLGFVQQANMYNMYDRYDAYSDLVTDASATSALIATGEYPYGHIHGSCFIRYWDTENKELAKWVADYKALSKEMNDGVELVPSGAALSSYLGIMTIAKAIEYCIKNNLDYKKPEDLEKALTTNKWSDFAGEHFYRDFDHHLTFDGWYVTSADGGDALGHAAIGTDKDICYHWDQWLPTLEDMKNIAVEMGYPDRFKDF